MSYTNRKKKKPSKASLKRERDNERAGNDAVWNEFYAQLIEYGMEHDTYQVPYEYTVTTDDHRILELGAWLQVQGKKLNDYSRTNPQWYSDILDLIETGKLWFDNDSKNTTPTNLGECMQASPSKATSSSSQPPPQKTSAQKTKTQSDQIGQSRDYAFSSDEDSDNSMVQHTKRMRGPSYDASDFPAIPEIPPVPTASRTSSHSPNVATKKTKDTSAASTVASSSKAAYLPMEEVGSKRKGHLPNRTAKARISGKSTYKEHSNSSESEEWENENDFDDDEEGFAQEEAAGDEGDEEESEVEDEDFTKPAARKLQPSRGVEGAKPSRGVTTPIPGVTKTAPAISVAARSSAEASRPSIYSSASAFATMQKKEKTAEEARKIADSKRHHVSEASNRSVQSIQSLHKRKSTATNVPVASAAISQPRGPTPPTIPLVATEAKKAAAIITPPDTRALPSATGLMRPEQCVSTANGIMPLRRTLSRPKPVLAPPTPPPAPVLAPRTPASSKEDHHAPLVTPKAPSGALPHVTANMVTVEPAVPTSEITFSQKIRQMKLQKEAAAAAHGSPRSDVSNTGSDLPALSLTAASKTAQSSPRRLYTGIDVTKKRNGISEHKLAAVRAAAQAEAEAEAEAEAARKRSSCVNPDEAKDSPRTGTASNSSGSSPHECLATADESEETASEDDEEMVIVGGRRGQHRATPRRIDDFNSQVSSQQTLPPPDSESSRDRVVGSAMEMETTPTHEAEIIEIDDNTTVTTTVRDRAPSVFSIHSDTTAGNEGGGGEQGTDVDDDDDEDDSDDDSDESDEEEEVHQSTQKHTRQPVQQSAQPAHSADPSAPQQQYCLELDSDGEESVEEVSTPPAAAATQNTEFVAFAYTRSSSGPQCPMLGVGMVCNADNDLNDSLYLIVMVPENVKQPVTSEFRMDPDEFITVQRQLVLARDLSFVDGGRGGVFDEASQAKISTVLRMYPNLQIDPNFL